MCAFSPEEHTPIVDNLTLSCRYNSGFPQLDDFDEYRSRLNARFDALCKVIETDTGRTLQDREDDNGDWCKYVPGYGVYLLPPEPTYGHGYGHIHFEPTASRLNKLQSWLKRVFGFDLRGVVSLKFLELAYDYETDLDAEDFDALAVRVGARLAPRNALYGFAVAIRSEGKRRYDGAINHGVMVYVQSTKRKSAGKHSNKLNWNKKSAGHTSVYGKTLHSDTFLRIEQRLSRSKAKRCGIRFNPNNLAEIMELPELPFSTFWQFKADIDLRKFARFQIQNPMRHLKQWFIKKRLFHEGNSIFPVSDSMRYLAYVSKCSRGVQRARRSQIASIDFAEVVNTPLPGNFFISRRKAKKCRAILNLPDDSGLPEHITLKPYIHKPLPEPKPKDPVKPQEPVRPSQPRLFDLP